MVHIFSRVIEQEEQNNRESCILSKSDNYLLRPSFKHLLCSGSGWCGKFRNGRIGPRTFSEYKFYDAVNVKKSKWAEVTELASFISLHWQLIFSLSELSNILTATGAVPAVSDYSCVCVRYSLKTHIESARNSRSHDIFLPPNSNVFVVRTECFYFRG